MFDLIESCPERREGLGWTGRIVSALIHIFLLSAAIAATRGVLQAVEDDGPRPVDIGGWPEPRPPIPHQGGRPSDGSTPVMPVVIPAEIPEPGAITPDIPGGDPAPSIPGFDPGPALPPGNTLPPVGSTLLTVRQVDEQPELLAHPALHYPEVLRRAGIEGRVVIEAVLDTSGRAETASLRVVSSAHPLFDPEALAVVSGSSYRPARLAGRAVRVRVRVPVSFTLRT